jgi:hypothetical protein
VEFVKESLVFTGEDSPMANLMLSVTGAFAEFERLFHGKGQFLPRQRAGTTWFRRGEARGAVAAITPTMVALDSLVHSRGGFTNDQSGLKFSGGVTVQVFVLVYFCQNHFHGRPAQLGLGLLDSGQRHWQIFGNG